MRERDNTLLRAEADPLHPARIYEALYNGTWYEFCRDTSAPFTDVLPMGSLQNTLRTFVDGRPPAVGIISIGDVVKNRVAEIEAAVKSGPERKFVYAYWPQYDATSHRYGSQSAEAEREYAAHHRTPEAVLAETAMMDF